MTTRPTRTARALVGATAIAGALAGASAPALAGDCGADYAACLEARRALDGSDWLHETECHGAYWRCVSSRVLSF